MTELTPRAARKRRKIMDEAARVFATEGPLAMNDLVKKLEVSRATLYRYFPTREELVRSIAIESFEDTRIAVEGLFDDVLTNREAFERLFEALIPLGHYHFLSREWGLMEDEEVMALVDEQNKQVLAMIEQAQAAGELDANTPSHWIARHFDSMVWIAWEAVYSGHVARRDIARLTFNTFWSGVGVS